MRTAEMNGDGVSVHHNHVSLRRRGGDLRGSVEEPLVPRLVILSPTEVVRHESEFQRDLRLGDLFLFINRRGDQIKLIYWDGAGLAIWMKRLERGTFQRPSRANDGKQVEMDVTELNLLLSGIDLDSAKRRKRYAVNDTIRDKLRDSASSRPT